jgi:glycosyltransferase involved in cell wall biosynthesis
MRTFRTAHALAARGHDIHVVTNAKEVAPPFRMHMRDEDWLRCESHRDRGTVTVHWTDPVDRTQNYIPMASPFVTKLASLAARAHDDHSFDVIFSHYLEPYGVAGHLASMITGLPHVVRLAGSDAARLWPHPQFEPLYDHVLRSAEALVAVGVVAQRAVTRGVDPRRILSGGAYGFPDDLLVPAGPAMNLSALRQEIQQASEFNELLWGDFAGAMPHFGIYGKLGENKGSFAVLAALHHLKRQGLDVGLVAMAHGHPDVEMRFRARAEELGLADRVLQVPFMPHWRVPEFLRSCLAVCCLEQGFPVTFHSPITPLEVLLCGKCLVASTEVLRKLPQWRQLPDKYACVAIKDVHDIDELSSKLAAIVRQPLLTATVGARGRAFALDCQSDIEFPKALEELIEAAAKRHIRSYTVDLRSKGLSERGAFPLTQIATTVLSGLLSMQSADPIEQDQAGFDLDRAKLVRNELVDWIAKGHTKLQVLAQAVDVELSIAQTEAALDNEPPDELADDPLFRLDIDEWALVEGSLGRMNPIRSGRTRILRFDHDISQLLQMQSLTDFPDELGSAPSQLVVFARSDEREPLLIDGFTARILELSDGTHTGEQICDRLQQEDLHSTSSGHLAWIENLMVCGLLGLRSPTHALRPDPV